MTHESLNQWNFVVAAYVIGVGGTLITVGWSWLAMRRAEAHRPRGLRQRTSTSRWLNTPRGVGWQASRKGSSRSK